jgi:hypothetical protein
LQRVGPATDEVDGGARPGQRESDGGTNTGASPRDDGRSVLKNKHWQALA